MIIVLYLKVLTGPESDVGQHRWYFSLNNRRLWVLKRCREEGLLESTKHQILVRVRHPKSQSEKERYTIHKCVVEAKIIPEKRKSRNNILSDNSRNADISMQRSEVDVDIPNKGTSSDDEDVKSDSSSSNGGSNDGNEGKRSASNRFTPLL